MTEESKISSGVPVKRMSTNVEIHLTKEENGKNIFLNLNRCSE